MKFRLILAAFLVLYPLSLSAQQWVLRFDGIGPVKIGMTLAELNNVLHENFVSEGSCFQSHSKLHPGVEFMIEDGAVSRVDITASTVRSIQGVGVGDIEPRVRKVLGKGVEIEKHHYFEHGHYLTLYSKNSRFAMRFETTGDKMTNAKNFEAGTEPAKLIRTKHFTVTTFYAGRPESIAYIEGCL